MPAAVFSSKRLPGEVAIGLVKPFLIGDDVRQRRLRHVRLVGQHDHLFQRFDRAGDLFEQRHEGQVDEDRLVLGIVHDPDDLLGKQPRIERVIDRADAHDAVPGLDVARRVPGQRGDAVAKPEAVALEPLGDLQRAAMDVGDRWCARSDLRSSATRSRACHAAALRCRCSLWQSSGHSCISPSIRSSPALLRLLFSFHCGTNRRIVQPSPAVQQRALIENDRENRHNPAIVGVNLR